MDKENEKPIQENPPEEGNTASKFFVLYKQQIWGFIGWFVIASILAPVSFGLITTPATVICLIALGLSKNHNRKGIAGGILAAVALNFLVSMVRGLSTNAWCFMPFYINTF
jgi:hypothetical protein